jgi:hypothetical protein
MFVEYLKMKIVICFPTPELLSAPAVSPKESFGHPLERSEFYAPLLEHSHTSEHSAGRPKVKVSY